MTVLKTNIKKRHRYVRDRDVLSRICCDPGQYAIYNDNDIESNDPGLLDENGLELDVPDYDDDNNHDCRHDYFKTEDGYDGIKGCFHGDITVFEKIPGEKYPSQRGMYTSDGMYLVESARGCTVYSGRDGRAACLAMPQCKFMNNTVHDWDPMHDVFSFDSSDPLHLPSREWKMCGPSRFKEGAHKENLDTGRFFERVPFDVWCIAGAVLGKALRIWRGPCGRNTSKFPKSMFISVQEIYELLMPRRRWRDAKESTRRDWMIGVDEAMDYLKYKGLFYDMPSRDGRMEWEMGSMLIGSGVRRWYGGSDRELLDRYGNYVPYGYKMELPASPLWRYCWETGNATRNPRLVQLHQYDYDFRRMLGDERGWHKCFGAVYVAWCVNLRNHFRKHGVQLRRGCDVRLEIKAHRLRDAVSGGCFGLKRAGSLTSREIGLMLERYSAGYVEANKCRRPAHVGEWEEIPGGWSWTLPESLAGEAAVFKDEDGHNLTLDEAGVQLDPVSEKAVSRMKAINEANEGHRVVDGRGNVVGTAEAVIWKLDGNGGFDPDRYGRCYSFGNGVQCLKREERSRLTIDGLPSAEVDYSSLHPRMLYAMAGVVPARKDMYDVGSSWWRGTGLTREEARECVKGMMLRMINARSFGQAWRSFKDAWNKGHGLPKSGFIPWIFPLAAAIRQAHAPIAHMFNSNAGTMLMAMDGRLIREVCWRLAREGRCALGIHDSVVTDALSAEFAAKVMREEFERMFPGQSIPVKIKHGDGAEAYARKNRIRRPRGGGRAAQDKEE